MSGVSRLAALFAEARRPVAFTGAGVSTESGIPDFRSPGGVWARFDPSEFTYQNFIGSDEGRRRYWALGRVTYPVIRAAAPGAAHLALAELHRLGRLDCCITQNIDDLHQRAGLPADAVIELHGNATRARCLDCGERLHARRAARPARARRGRARLPGVRRHREAAHDPVRRGDAEGGGGGGRAPGRAPPICSWCSDPRSSSIPAAYMPLHAQRAGATLAIVNLEPTPLDAQADLVIRAHGRAR